MMETGTDNGSTANALSLHEPAIAPTTGADYVPIVARVPIAVRPATLADVAFIDRLQKAHSRELGFLPTQAIVGKIARGDVLIAEQAAGGGQLAPSSGNAEQTLLSPAELPAASCPPRALPLGYLIAADRYFKRDEIGYVTQLNVVPEMRRSLVAAQLLQAQFDRSAYGCRLYCCWCAQDLTANAFWEAMGFSAIAFRTGSMTKGKRGTPRVHIFWQKRIRAGDTGDLSRGGTPWWYPAQTGGGALRADRLVFPIPAGMHWRDVGPILLDSNDRGGDEVAGVPAMATLATPVATKAASAERKALGASRKSKKASATPTPAKVQLRSPRMPGGLWFVEEGVPVETPPQAGVKAKRAAPAAADVSKEIASDTSDASVIATAKPSIDPRLTAMARELRDQWGERSSQIVPPPEAKHDVKRVATPTQAGCAALPGEASNPRRLATAA